jgi:hypothetical protein
MQKKTLKYFFVSYFPTLLTHCLYFWLVSKLLVLSRKTRRSSNFALLIYLSFIYFARFYFSPLFSSFFLAVNVILQQHTTTTTTTIIISSRVEKQSTKMRRVYFLAFFLFKFISSFSLSLFLSYFLLPPLSKSSRFLLLLYIIFV